MGVPKTVLWSDARYCVSGFTAGQTHLSLKAVQRAVG